ncbi:fibronectin type III domain-containing protein [Vagococcus sp. BWB3-3]|uniref:Fibronectin type III domain-containing protein n=1 Tax=Vagococcus allomyrinae TaxID=2794353 RepID=A0A940PFI3_9ENTE|nr:fibronectin type III domain-containing protein [Vagococcus allomyrinae]MBP1043929.1 fibronectin type III domain-containing protein [Vagococcus allomyrinae]
MKKKRIIVTAVLLALASPVQALAAIMDEEVILMSGEVESSEAESLETSESGVIENTTVEELNEPTCDELDVSLDSEFISEVVESEETVSESSDEKPQGRALVEQDVDGFWLVDSAATLTELLKDSQKLKFRLTQDIDLGTKGYRLKNGVVIDGGHHKIVYDKGGYYDRGFYIDETNATVEIRNTQFGNTDGTKAVGYYGFLTGYDSGKNMTFIFDNVDYYSNNGQMIFNRHGSIIMRGNNTIVQLATGTYGQEWAETNYVEVQSGTTTVEHFSLSTSAFIWSVSADVANPRANSSQIVVRQNADMTIKTNGAMTYDYLAPSYLVEENGQLLIDKVSLASGEARNAFFYFPQTQKVTFDFRKNSRVTFLLPAPINLGSASGGMTIGEGAKVKMEVAGGTIFTPNNTSTFLLRMDDPEYVEFMSSGKGTLGLSGLGATTSRNLSFVSSTVQKIETYTSKAALIPSATIVRSSADLRVRVDTYTNAQGSVNPLTTTELSALGGSQKLVFSQTIAEPSQVKAYAHEVTATTAQLQGSSINNGSLATEVTWYLYTAEADLNDPAKAQQTVTLRELDQGNGVGTGTFQSPVDGLTPNTKYWVQAVVSNQVGQSPLSTASTFITLPSLDRIRADILDEHSALIAGRLLGGNYTQVTVEYSLDSQFPTGNTWSATTELMGVNNRLFTASLSDLIADKTYYVRAKVRGLSGEDVTLVTTPITKFRTSFDLINVEIPIEMAFQTEAKELGKNRAGEVTSAEYEVVNHGDIPMKVSLASLSAENEEAEGLLLRQDFESSDGSDELALQLIADGGEPHFITGELAKNPLELGVLGIGSNNRQGIRFTGKYFNPTREAVFPIYKLTFKVEING